MSFFKFTTDKTVKQLRWVMVCTILFDKFNTLVGQPISYWRNPKTVIEGDRFVHYFLSQGIMVYIAYSLAYLLIVFFLASIIPRRLALVGLIAEIFGHYFGACTWLVYYWHFGPCASGIYGIVLGLVFVKLVFSDSSKSSSTQQFRENGLRQIGLAICLCFASILIFFAWISIEHRISSTDHQAVKDNHASEIGGVGVSLGINKQTGDLQIINVRSNTPASESGLTDGLIIYRIDLIPTKGKSIHECVNLIRGTVGTKVQLELIDYANNKTNAVKLIRENIQLPH